MINCDIYFVIFNSCVPINIAIVEHIQTTIVVPIIWPLSNTE